MNSDSESDRPIERKMEEMTLKDSSQKKKEENKKIEIKKGQAKDLFNFKAKKKVELSNTRLFQLLEDRKETEDPQPAKKKKMEEIYESEDSLDYKPKRQSFEQKLFGAKNKKGGQKESISRTVVKEEQDWYIKRFKESYI